MNLHETIVFRLDSIIMQFATFTEEFNYVDCDIVQRANKYNINKI